MFNISLLLSAAVIIICVLANKLSNKIGMPVLIAFIALGMVFGSDGILKIPFENYSFAEQICSVALVFIMFYGGFGTKLSEAKPVAVRHCCCRAWELFSRRLLQQCFVFLF